MLSLKRLVRATGTVLALAAATISTSANAGFYFPGFGVGPNNNGWGMNPQQNVGIIGAQFWGMDPHQNAGLFAPPFFGMSPQQNAGLFAPPFFGMNPQQNAGLFAPPFWGMNPQQNLALLNPIFWGMNAQQNAGLFFPPFMGINPNANYPVASQMPYQAQSGPQPVQCSINAVPALTKDVDDCEKAGGDVAGAKTADASKK